MELFFPTGHLLFFYLYFFDLSFIAVETVESDSEDEHEDAECDPYFASSFFFFGGKK